MKRNLRPIKENVEIFRGIPPEEYREYLKYPERQEIILNAIGWIVICKNCGQLLKPKRIDPNKFDLRKCRETKPNEKCYVVRIRCRDVELQGVKCRNLPKTLGKWDSLAFSRWHFLDQYAFYHRSKDVREDKEYCSEKCRKQDESRRHNQRKIAK